MGENSGSWTDSAVANCGPRAGAGADYNRCNHNKLGHMTLSDLVKPASKHFTSCALAVIVASLAGCGGTDEENQHPTALFTIANDALDAPVVVAFDGSASMDADGEIVSYTWAFGDGSEATGIKVEHEFTVAGQYDVTLTVVDNDGASTSYSHSLQVMPRENAQPVATIAVSQMRGVAPLEAELSAAKSKDEDGTIVSYEWEFHDGSTAEGEAVTRVYSTPGDYAVRLTVTDDEGANAEETLTLTVLPANATFTVSGTITALPYTDVDGDINDPFAQYVDNNGHHAVNAHQPITNPVLLNGFVTARQTAGIGDRFEFETDYIDIFSVELQEGDYVSLQVVDVAFADIDLFLMDGATGNAVAFSDGNNEFESVQAPYTGNYLIRVEAVDYFSKYLLKVGESSMVAGPQASGKSADFEPDQAIVKFRENTTGLVAAQSTLNGAQLELNHSGRGRAALAKINRLNPQTRTMLQLQSTPDGFDTWLAQKNPKALAKLETIRALSRLAAQPDVEYAEPNYRVKPFLIPSDPAYIFQWHYPAINLPQAWDVTTGSPDVVVAVVDSGVYLQHPDLQGQLLPGYDFISVGSYANDGDGIDPDPDDPGDGIHIGRSSWHGTHVAGTVAAAMGNNEGGVGVAPGARVMPLRALGKGGGLAYDILQSVRYAAGLENDSGTLPERPADIINLSLGGSGYSQATQNLYREVREKGIIVIAAAGNENTDEPMYPASYEGVVSVAASDFHGERAPYSNRSAFIDITGPGGVITADQNGDGYSDGILSSVAEETTTSKQGNYIFYQGTSMAAPHVAGVAALMKSVYPSLTADEFDSLLISGAITSDKGLPGRDDEYGYGVIDAQLAVNAAQGLADGATTAAIYADRNVLAFDDSNQQAQIEIRAIGNDDIHVVDATTDADWLSIAPVDAGTDGIGTYVVSVDPTDLEDGTYRGFVRFSSDRETYIDIQVTMRVGEFVPVGNAGFLYVMLIDALTGDRAVLGLDALEGLYEYKFEGIPVGDYFLAAGSDIDNNDLVCNTGESCGYYPSLGDFTMIRVDTHKTDTDFSAGLLEAFGAQSTDTEQAGLSNVPSGFGAAAK